jgi:hypothetical protein
VAIEESDASTLSRVFAWSDVTDVKDEGGDYDPAEKAQDKRHLGYVGISPQGVDAVVGTTETVSEATLPEGETNGKRAREGGLQVKGAVSVAELEGVITQVQHQCKDAIMPCGHPLDDILSGPASP